MKTGAKGLAFVKLKERFMAQLYYCEAKKPTIGYGHVIGAGEAHLRTATLTEPQASALLLRDLTRYENAVLRGTEAATLTQNQFDACVALCYNIGEAGFEGSTVARLISARAGEASIRQAWSAWNKITDPVTKKKVESRGLTIRRKQEADLYFSK